MMILGKNLNSNILWRLLCKVNYWIMTFVSLLKNETFKLFEINIMNNF
jgi:hypothetical protein